MLFSRKSELDAYSNKTPSSTVDHQYPVTHFKNDSLQINSKKVISNKGIDSDDPKQCEQFFDNYELRSFTETPKNPTYSPRKSMVVGGTASSFYLDKKSPKKS